MLAIAWLISAGGAAGSVWALGFAARQYAHSRLPTRSGAPQFRQRVSSLGIRGEHNVRRQYGLGTGVADDGRPDREELDDVAAPAGVPLVHLDDNHPSGAARAALVLRP